MKLTCILLRKLPRGHIFRGKYRIVKKVEWPGLKELYFDYQREEQNMLLLRHPYLTVQQSHGHMKAMGTTPDRKTKWEDEKIEKFRKVVTLEDRLMHLKVKDAWD